MYTLRKVPSSGVQINIVLGGNYAVVTRESNEKEFVRMYEAMHGCNENSSVTDDEDVYAILSSEGGKQFYALYKNQENYVMSEGGKTFSNLTFK